MRRLVIYTYFLVLFFSVSFGLIQIELALSGAAEMQPLLWFLQLFKSGLVIAFVIATEEQDKLCLRVYIPQTLMNVASMATISNKSSWVALAAGYILLVAAVYPWTFPRRYFYRLYSATDAFRLSEMAAHSNQTHEYF